MKPIHLFACALAFSLGGLTFYTLHDVAELRTHTTTLPRSPPAADPPALRLDSPIRAPHANDRAPVHQAERVTA